MNAYGVELNKRIAAKGLSAQVLAKRIGKSSSFVSDLGLGKKVNIPEARVLRIFERDLDWPMVDQLVAFGYLETGEVGDKNDPPIVRELTMLMRKVEWDYRAEEAMRGILEGLIRSSGTANAGDPPSPDPAES